MSDLLIQLQDAAASLEDQEIPVRERLRQAAQTFWKAMYDPGAWPPELAGKANFILEKLLQDGTIDATVQNLDDASARELAQRIVCLADDLKKLMCEGLPAGPPAPSATNQDPGSALIREVGEQDARLRRILDIRSESLFTRSPEALQAFYRHLAAHLTLPFPANHCDPTSEALTMDFVTVVEVLDPQTHPHEDGMLCRVIKQGAVAELPLAQLEVPPECRNYAFSTTTGAGSGTAGLGGDRALVTGTLGRQNGRHSGQTGMPD